MPESAANQSNSNRSNPTGAQSGTPNGRISGRGHYARSEDTRARILDATLVEAGKAGFHNTSVAKIAARAEVAIGILNYHFGSKGELLRELMASQAGEFLALLKPPEPHDDYFSYERSLLLVYLQFLRANPSYVRLAEEVRSHDPELYRDPSAAATTTPAAIPARLSDFAALAVERLVAQRAAIDRALGEVLSEPKPHVWFRGNEIRGGLAGVRLDRKTRMLYDSRHVFINGEAVPARGRGGALLKRLADERTLDARAVRGSSPAVRSLLRQWLAAGWLQRA